MASLADIFNIIDSNIPDSGNVPITPANVRACLYAVASYTSGEPSIEVTVMEGATSITNAALIGKTVRTILGDAFVKKVGFTQPNSSGTITFTDGTTLIAGNYSIFYAQ